jgi:hypothetical protein
MNKQTTNDEVQFMLPSGAGVAAVLSAALGTLALAVLSITADHFPDFKKLMIFYTPTGALSGVTTIAVGLWLISWISLDAAWKRSEIHSRWIGAGLCLIVISFLLMFPPIGDLL